jgi:hypothetical protein
MPLASSPCSPSLALWLPNPSDHRDRQPEFGCLRGCLRFWLRMTKVGETCLHAFGRRRFVNPCYGELCPDLTNSVEHIKNASLSIGKLAFYRQAGSSFPPSRPIGSAWLFSSRRLTG